MREPHKEGYHLAYKFRLYPNRDQQEYFNKCFGCTRFVYNYFLNERIKAYTKTKEHIKKLVVNEEGEPILDESGKRQYEEVSNPEYDPQARSMTFYDTSKALTRLKKETVDEEGHKWLYDADSTALVYALRHLDSAYQNFFRRVKQGGDLGFPKFKSRYNSNQSFTTAKPTVEDNAIVLNKIGRIKAKIHREVKGEIIAATISRNAAGQYYAAIKVKDADIEPLPTKNEEVGITLGLKKWITTSDGQVYVMPEKIKQLEKKLAKEQRKLSRKVGARKGETPSENYKKQKLRVARIQNKIANIRESTTHEATRDIVNNYGVVITREMNPKNMFENDTPVKEKLPRKVQQKMNRAIASANFAEVNRQLAYKSQWAKRAFVELPSDVPTAQVCNHCGYKHVMLIKDLRAEWTCPNCGLVHDRKYNGAKNVLEAGMDVLHNEEESFVMQARKQKKVLESKNNSSC